MSAKNEGFFSCSNTCWLIGALIGLAVFMLLAQRFDFNIIVSLILGVIVAVALALFLKSIFCKDMAVDNGSTMATGAASMATTPSQPARAAEPTPVPVKPARVAKPTPKPAEPETPKVAEKPAAANLGEDYDKDGIREGTNEGTRPGALDGARGGKADDLKKIKGVGPKLEKVLNTLGFFHFDQVAEWSANEVAWVDANLTGFKGRVSRDNWVEQARLLATGGETEFSKRVDEGDVYD